MLVRLAGGGRGALAQVQRVAARAGVVAVLDHHLGGAGLGVPCREAGEVGAGRVGHGGHEVLDGHRLVVVAGEVEVHAAAEGGGADQGADHAHHLGALLVHGRGVEVVDAHVAVRPDRMGERAGVLGELPGAQAAHVGDALDRGRALVGGELLVAEHGQALLEGELEPVAAGDAVAGPVVEVLVGDHRLDALVVGVGGTFRPGQDVAGVEDVEALVLHRAHVEVGHGGDVEHVEVVFEAEGVLVPAHRRPERAHRVAAAVLVAGAHPDRQRHVAAGAGGEAVTHRDQVAGDEGEQVGRLGVRVDPAGPVPAALGLAGVGAVAVGQQHRVARAVGDQGDGEAGHHVRAVGEEGDAAEALRLALGEEAAGRDVEPAQLRVGLGRDAHQQLELEAVRHRVDQQVAVLDAPRGRGERVAVDRGLQQLERLAVELQPARGGAGRGVAAQRQAGAHRRRRGVEREHQVEAVHQEGGRPVVGAQGRAGRAGRHGQDGVVGVWHGGSRALAGSVPPGGRGRKARGGLAPA